MLSQIVSILQIAVMIVCPVCCISGTCPAEQCCDSALDFSKLSSDQFGITQRYTSDSSEAALSTCCNDCGNSTEKTGSQIENSQTQDLLETKLVNSNCFSKTTCPTEPCPSNPCSEQSCQCVCGGALSENSVDSTADSENALCRSIDTEGLGPSLFGSQLAQSRSHAASLLHHMQSGNTGRAARILLRSFLI